MITIREVEAEQLHGVRRRVLRENRRDARVEDDRDHDHDVLHLAAVHNELIVGSASVYPSDSPSPDFVGVTYQLRYLAVDDTLQRMGVGSQLMRAIEDRLCSRGADVLWANGRDSALDFYRSTGWVVMAGSAHLSPETQLPHHVIAKNLRDHRTLEIRRARLEDAEVLVDLRARMMYSIDLTENRGSWLESTLNYFTQGLGNDSILGFVATVDHQVVASAMAEIRTTVPSPRKPTGRIAYLHTVATLPTFRRRGVSRDLLRQLVETLSGYQVDALELHATNQGLPLYEQLGFVLRNGNEMRRWMS